MIDLKCKTFSEFASNVSNIFGKIQDTYYPCISIIAKYDEMRNVIAELIRIGHPLSCVSEFTNPDFDGYDREFVLSLDDEGIWVEPMCREENAWNKAGYLTVEDEICYVLDNCNSKLLSSIRSNCIFTVQIGNDDTPSDSPSHQKEIGVSTEKVKRYFVNDKEVEKTVFNKYREETSKIFADFDADFTNMLRDALLFQCAYRDKYNDMLKLFW